MDISCCIIILLNYREKKLICVCVYVILRAYIAALCVYIYTCLRLITNIRYDK